MKQSANVSMGKKAGENELRRKCHEMIRSGCRQAVSGVEEMNRFLQVLGRFCIYSVNNNLLIYMQNPTAMLLRDRAGWAREDVSVEPTAEGVWIFEPQSYVASNGEERMTFSPKAVYDISETFGAEHEAQVSFDHKLIVRALISHSPQRIITTAEDDRANREGAYWDSQRGVIFAKTGMSADEIFHTVGMAMAQAELVRIKSEESTGTFYYRQSEQAFEARCVLVTLAKKYGIPTERFAVRSIPDSYARMEQDEIKQDLRHIRDAVKSIAERMDPVLYRKGREITPKRESNGGEER